MQLKKLYKHDNKKQIWRILPTTNKKVVVEERDPLTKEVFFSCFDLESGKKIFNNFQLEEKNWVGIESVYNDMIYFHSYGNPEMPAHKSIIAFDIISESIVWRNDNYVFSFLYDDKIYCYQQRFETRKFYTLNCYTGKIVEELNGDYDSLNKLKTESLADYEKQNYLFPEYFNRSETPLEEYQKYLQDVLTNNAIKGYISYLLYNDILIFNYHEVNNNNTLNNKIIAVDIPKNTILFKDTLDKNLINLMPESFFVKDNFLFLIADKTKLFVYQII
jgi:hypothetical protein